MPPRRSVSTCRPHCSRAPTRSSNELRTGLWRPTLEDENGKPLADLGLLAKQTRLAIVPWLLVFFIGGAISSLCSAAWQYARVLLPLKRHLKCSARSTQPIRHRRTAPQAPRNRIRANADNCKASGPSLFERLWQPSYRSTSTAHLFQAYFAATLSGFAVCGENLARISQFVAGIRQGNPSKRSTMKINELRQSAPLEQGQ